MRENPADISCRRLAFGKGAPPLTPPLENQLLSLGDPLIAAMFKFSAPSTIPSSSSSQLFVRSLLRKQQVPAVGRSFHASAANMVVKAHFDVSWTGPEYQTDASGKVTSRDEAAKRE